VKVTAIASPTSYVAFGNERCTAKGGAAVETTAWVVSVACCPPCAKTVRVTVYVPGFEYAWLAVAPCAVAPSPNVQR